MKAIKEFGESLIEFFLAIGTFLLIVAMIMLNAFVIIFTLVMWHKGSDSIFVGALASVLVFLITKSLTTRVILGREPK